MDCSKLRACLSGIPSRSPRFRASATHCWHFASARDCTASGLGAGPRFFFFCTGVTNAELLRLDFGILTLLRTSKLIYSARAAFRVLDAHAPAGLTEKASVEGSPVSALRSARQYTLVSYYICMCAAA